MSERTGWHGVGLDELARARVARELHDGALQSVLHLSRIAASRPDGSADLAELALDVAHELRAVCRDLRPPALDHLGLLPALEAATDRLRAEAAAAGEEIALHCTVRGAEQVPGLPEPVRVALYRVALEAMTNAVRHAGARTVSVRLRVHGDGGVLEVADDGRGFAPRPELLDALVADGHLGVAGMVERVAEVGGTCALLLNEAGGTTVAVRVGGGVPDASDLGPVEAAGEVSRV